MMINQQQMREIIESNFTYLADLGFDSNPIVVSDNFFVEFTFVNRSRGIGIELSFETREIGVDLNIVKLIKGKVPKIAVFKGIDGLKTRIGFFSDFLIHIMGLNRSYFAAVRELNGSKMYEENELQYYTLTIAEYDKLVKSNIDIILKMPDALLFG